MEWIKCSDRMPPVDDSCESKILTIDVLLISESGDIWQGYFDYKDFTWNCAIDVLNEEVLLPTHWMPLPQPPKS